MSVCLCVCVCACVCERERERLNLNFSCLCLGLHLLLMPPFSSQISSPQAVLQVARGAGRAGGGDEKMRDAKSSWVGQLGSDLMKDVGF